MGCQITPGPPVGQEYIDARYLTEEFVEGTNSLLAMEKIHDRLFRGALASLLRANYRRHTGKKYVATKTLYHTLVDLVTLAESVDSPLSVVVFCDLLDKQETACLQEIATRYRDQNIPLSITSFEADASPQLKTLVKATGGIFRRITTK